MENATICQHVRLYIVRPPTSFSDWISFILGSPIGILISLLGLVGNTLTILVLHRESKKSDNASFGLKALATVDNVVIVFYSFERCVQELYDKYGIGIGAFELLHTVTPYLMYSQYVVKMLAIYVTVLITVQRYLAVSRPLKAAQYGSKKKTLYGIIGIVIFSFVINIPNVFAMQTNYKFDECFGRVVPVAERSEFGESWWYQVAFLNGAMITFAFVTPFLSLSILNALLIKNVRQATANRKKMTGDTSAQDNTMTLRMIAIVMAFLIMELPYWIVHLIVTYAYNNIPMVYQYDFFHNLLTTLAASGYLAQAQHSINFYIYVLIGDRFKNTLKQVLGCRTDTK